MTRSILFGICAACATAAIGIGVQAQEPLKLDVQWRVDKQHQYYTFVHDGQPVFRYNFGSVPMPPGKSLAHFADGRTYGGERSDYLHPVYGFDGEVITDDYPEHLHHRGIWWSWPVVRWNDQVADIWAVCQVWARPQKVKAHILATHEAELKATNLWKFGEKEQHPIVREELTLQASSNEKKSPRSRVIDITVTLTALEDGVAIGGRPGGGYGGMTYRAAPGEQQEIVPFISDDSAEPREAWCRYTADFPGKAPRTSLVLIQHHENPGYPTAHNVYADINCFMPAFPGDSEFPLRKGVPVTLKHRVWIVEGVPSHEETQTMWKKYQSN